MWKKILICATFAALMTVSAEARGHRGHGGSNSGSVAALGGFLTGLIVSDALARPMCTTPIVVTDSWSDIAWRTDGWDYGRTYHAYDRPSYRYPEKYTHRNDYRRGDWGYREIRVWVPGTWDVVCDRYGRSTRVWRNGYYDVRREKVRGSSYRRY